jgi:hypothetical protein
VNAVPVDADKYDQFLRMYDANLSTMRNAVPIAVEQRAQILADPSAYLLLTAQNGTWAGACVLQLMREADMLRVRFSAVDGAHRAANLTRAMYLAAVTVARDHGLGTVCLGNDPNLFGHLVRPGLLEFKSRIGFRPVAAQTIPPNRGRDIADAVRGARGLTDPTLMFTYRADPPGMVLTAYSAETDPHDLKLPQWLSGQLRTRQLPVV